MNTRTQKEQVAFRESLYDQHRVVFQGHNIFCHACLSGFWNKRTDLPQKVAAHHIVPYVRAYNKPWVNGTNNGILLATFFHDEIHKEYWRRNERVAVEAITREFVGRNFNTRWRDMKDVRLRNGANFVDTWEAHLVSKGLITTHNEPYPVAAALSFDIAL